METNTLALPPESEQPQQDMPPEPKTEFSTETSHSDTRYQKGEKIDWIDLIDHQTSMHGSTTMETAQNFFRDHPECRYGVVLDDSDHIIGLCSEQKIGNTLSQWGLGYAVFARKPIQHHTLENDFQIVRGTPVYKVLNRIMKRQEDFFDDVILIDAEGTFLGLIRVASLVHLQHEINRQQYDEIKRFSAQMNRNNEELAQARDTAMQAADMKSSFLANMSHEIRTPLNGILGMVKILLRTPLNESQRRYAQTVQHSGSALLTILNDILDFSKIEAGKMDLEEIPFNLNELIDEVTQLMDERAREKGLELFSWVNSDVPSQLISDPARLRQVLLNLVSNAIKFTEKGEVMIRVTRESDQAGHSQIKLSVSDTGIGISPENQAKLFQAFQQADSSTNRKFGGTGLGLAISRKLVELLGGQIQLESQEGRGSTFSFTIQFKKQEVELSQDAESEHKPDFWGVRALIITDNPSYAGFISEQITPWNIISKHIDSAEQAMSLALLQAQRGAPMDILFVDSQIGETSALDFVTELRTHASLESTRAILLTGQHDDVPPERIRELRITETLQKPIRTRNLQEAISASLARVPKDLTNINEETDPTTAKSGPSSSDGLQHDTAPESFVQPLKLLLVEDSEVNREVAMIQLRTWNHQIKTAENGKVALEILRNEHFDGILMDCQMPEMDGYEASSIIRKPDSDVTDHDIYIIAMTANALQGDREKCIAAGMNDYVSKPVDEFELLKALQRCADSTDQAAMAQPSSSPASPSETTEAEPDQIPDTIPEPPGSVTGSPFPPHLVELFLNETESRLNELRQFLEQYAMEEAARAAHTIKGTAGNFNAPELADLARQIESCCQDHNEEQAWELLPRIQEAYHQHRSTLHH